MPAPAAPGGPAAARPWRVLVPFAAAVAAAGAGLGAVAARLSDGTLPVVLVAAAAAGAAGILGAILGGRVARAIRAGVERGEAELRTAAAKLRRLNATLEKRVAARTAALEASRSRLDQFFTLFTSLQNPNTTEKTFELVLGFCQQMGYEVAMLSLVDRDAKVVRAVKAVGRLAEIVGMTVRPLNGDDILARVAREGRTVVIPDSTADPRCDAAAIAAAGIRGQIVLPLVSGEIGGIFEVVGVLQVASPEILNPSARELRALEALANEAARALAGLRHMERIRQLNRQMEQRNEQLEQLAKNLKHIALSEHHAKQALREAVRAEHEANDALKRAQSQLVQTEKLAALGQLVAGVAHEINNPLAFVGNNLAVLQRDVGSLRELLRIYAQGEECLAASRPDLLAAVRDLAGRIDLEYTLANLDGLVVRSREGLRRIQHIVKDLRDFARLDESDLQEADLNAGIESTVHIIRTQAKKREVELAVEAGPLPKVTCYPAKVNQVVLNLVANAIDACKPGGRVWVRTRPAGEGVEIEVADTGSGIDPAVRDRIFDPFFTTKPPGQGTGLGLSISYQIVRDHGGTIRVESAPGQGASFTVWLPARPPAASADAEPGGGAEAALAAPDTRVV